ncbi:hypothetical protein JB92DRAFT_1796697 [Gautieria morchelliformis]|nr:hypothetical protein JB92DRAFT_1796697 [Gautieria morchelliformis]
MPRSSPSASPVSAPSHRLSRRHASKASDRPPKRRRRCPNPVPSTVAKYPYGPPNPSDPREVFFSILDADKLDARPLVAADDLISHVLDKPRAGLRVSTVGEGSFGSTHEYRDFMEQFKITFRRKVTHALPAANVFAARMQARELTDKDTATSTAFSNLCLRYAQLKYHSSRVEVSPVCINDTRQSCIIATAPIPKGTLIYELGGLMSADAISPVPNATLTPNPERKRKPDPAPAYNTLSVVLRAHGQRGPGPHGDRLLLGPARFVNHSCKSNCKLKPFPGPSIACGIEASRDVAAGEEITVDYGEMYFAPGECACAPCQAVAARKAQDAPGVAAAAYPTPPAETESEERPRKRRRTGRC